MMRGVFMSALLAATVIAGFGCQNSSAPASQTMALPGRAIVVSGGNSGTPVAVFLPSNEPANPVVICAAGTTVCPECKAAAAKYFSTGILDPKCSLTGATRSAVVGVPLNYGHN